MKNYQRRNRRTLGGVGDYTQEEFDAAVDAAIDTAYDSGVDFGTAAGIDDAYGDMINAPAPGSSAPAADKSWWESFLTPDKVQAVASAKTAYDLNQINIDRLKKGLAPLPASYMTAVAPRLNVGLPADQMNMLLIGGAVIAVALLARKG